MQEVMAKASPERMGVNGKSAIHTQRTNGLGEKQPMVFICIKKTEKAA